MKIVKCKCTQKRQEWNKKGLHLFLGESLNDKSGLGFFVLALEPGMHGQPFLLRGRRKISGVLRGGGGSKLLGAGRVNSQTRGIFGAGQS